LFVLDNGNPLRITVNVGEHRGPGGAEGMRRNKRRNDGVHFATVIGNHKLELNDRARQGHLATGRRREVDFGAAGAIRVDLVGAGFSGVEIGSGIEVGGVIDAGDAISHDKIDLSQVAVSIEGGDGYAVAVIDGHRRCSSIENETGDAESVVTLNRPI